MNAQQSLEADADAVMEQLIMQESRHMQMGALVDHQLHYPDMTIREFFTMVARELHEQEEELGYYD
jgi:ABC-type multidrug transport system ATPase subunit